MSRAFTFRHTGLTAKLLAMNVLILVVFALIGVVLLFSFNHIEELLTKTVVSDVSRNLQNAGLLRELSGVFSDTSLLAGSFVKKEEYLKTKGEQLVATTDRLAAQSTDQRLAETLTEFSRMLRAILDQCARINKTVRQTEDYNRMLRLSLEKLEKTISDRKMELILKGFDPTIMEQLSNLVNGYNETVLETNLLFAKAASEQIGSDKAERERLIIARLDELVPRMQTLTASESAIAGYGPLLTAEVKHYRNALAAFFQETAKLQQHLRELEEVKTRIMDSMKQIDAQLSYSTSTMRDAIRTVMHSSRRLILMLSIAAVLLSAAFTVFFILANIRKPMMLISAGIEAISGGNLETRIRLGRSDEWSMIEEALNRMASDLKTSYQELHAKNRDLENTQTKLNEKVAELVTEVEARTLAERELARQHEHLEEMVRERTADLEAAQEELIRREKLSVLGQLTATVSHELRNPLGVIRSSAFYLARRLHGTDEKVDKHIHRIEQQVTLSDSIVGDLLEYTRGSLSDTSEGDINVWLRELLEQLTPPEEICTLHESRLPLPPVRFDRDKMRRVVANLVENALHAVTARKEKEKEEAYRPRVDIATSRTGDGVQIVVEDNGTGMDGETAAHAFEPLFTTRARGTGLGLAIVRKIVEEHDGTVSLSSQPGSGTRATVWLPGSCRRMARLT
ncbi:ATP-binding protein [Geobacter sp. SVR]|uniref:sensor histidine kinase n=1 Tax=Geobacter sp. SVR TaxID=2495594 RepID=UPI00143F00EF|nr:ATP-binding protein [Geobacter sp. SVR]BCS53008.1 hypothetical protein GSVR_13160 [Geobacter sp. SVR]GCF84393.1 hypothetical protein GSbR_09930 [Geobacter sp. SVR]